MSRLVTPTGTKGCASHVGAGCTFCPGCHTRDKRAPPFVPDRRSRLGNRDNCGFPTETNQRFCSSGLNKRKHLPCLFCYPHQTGSTLRTRTTDHFGRHGHRTPLYCKSKYTGRRGAGEIRAGRRREKQAGGSRNARSG